jgi:hypothetical protein
MTRHAIPFIALLMGTLFSVASHAEEQEVSLPHVFSDAMGSNWDVQGDGSIGDGGNDLYDGGGRLLVENVGQYQSPTQRATLDVQRNELSFPPMQLGSVNLSRRVAVLAELSTVRFTEVIENPTGAAVTVRLRCYFNMGGGVQQSILLADPKHPRATVGYALGDQRNAVAMIGNGRTSKVRAQFELRNNDDNVTIRYDVEVPAHQTVAIVHFQIRRRGVADSADAWKTIKERDLLKSIPRDLRKRVINFPAGDALAGDLDILRGDDLDIVEMRGGDAYHGYLKIDHFRLQTVYGAINLPVEKVVSMINIGRYRPSQLVITREGDVFGGRLDLDSVKLQLTSGQITTIPLSQVTRLGYRRRAGEPEEWNFENKAAAYLRGGERIRVKLPARDFNLATTSGPVRLNPKFIASIVFQDADHNVPEIHLIDGTHISALLGASSFDMTLTVLGTEQHACMPAAALLRFTFAAEEETDDLAPRLILSNQDELIGTIGGTLSLETPFDTLHIEGAQIKHLTHTRGGEHDVKITLWDDSTFSGRLVESHVNCLLKCGMGISVPISLIDVYQQPLPFPSPPVIRQIHQIARDLDADLWATRNSAQAKLLRIGPSAMSVLKQIRPGAPAEAAQRIDVIMNRLTDELEKSVTVSSPVAPAVGGGFQDRFLQFDNAQLQMNQAPMLIEAR